MKHNYLLTLIMCLLLSSSLWAQDARKLVADFDKKGSVKAANRFFDYLDQEQFTDERIQFATNTPTDSLRKEVWYWAGEWFNDTQEYGLARQYALRALPLYRHDNAAKGDCLNLLAIIGVRLADFPAAAQYATRCVRIYKKLRDPDQTSSALNTLAGINRLPTTRDKLKSTSCRRYAMPPAQTTDRDRPSSTAWRRKSTISSAITSVRFNMRKRHT